MVKVYLRGVIISHTSAEKNIALNTQLALEEQVKSQEREFKANPSKTLGKHLDIACSALDHLLPKKDETAIFLVDTDSMSQAINQAAFSCVWPGVGGKSILFHH